MAGRDEASEVVSAGMAYRQLDVGGVQEITDANAAQVQAWIDEAPGPVLLHWASGNRAGALLAMVAARNGAPPEEALELGRRGMTSLQEPVRALLDLKMVDRSAERRVGTTGVSKCKFRWSQILEKTQ